MRALFLDLDHTLIRPLEGRTFPKDKYDWEFMPGVLEHVAIYLNKGWQILIISNQGGIEAGYHTAKEIDEKMEFIVSDLLWNIGGERGTYELKRGQLDYYFCPTNDKTHPDRKPNPGMIHKAAADHKIDLLNSLFIGDMEADEQAADAAGVPFMHIKDFLSSEHYVR